MTCDHEAQIRDLLEEREELLTEIVRLQRGNHPAGRALLPPDDAAWLAPAQAARLLHLLQRLARRATTTADTKRQEES